MFVPMLSTNSEILLATVFSDKLPYAKEQYVFSWYESKLAFKRHPFMICDQSVDPTDLLKLQLINSFLANFATEFDVFIS